jgi:hypothetical protein
MPERTTDYTPAMARELPMFESTAAGGAHHPQPELPISIGGGGLAGLPAVDGSVAQRRHPDWIKARCRPATTTTTSRACCAAWT